MRVLVIAQLTPEALRHDQSALQELESRASWALNASGLVRLNEFMAHRPGTVMTLKCESGHAVQKALETLPYCRPGRASEEVIPPPNYTAWERLFAPASEGDKRS